MKERRCYYQGREHPWAFLPSEVRTSGIGVGGGRDSRVYEYEMECLASSITSIWEKLKFTRGRAGPLCPQPSVHYPHPQTNPLVTGSLPSSHGSPQEFPLRRKFPGIFPESPVHPSPHRKYPRDSPCSLFRPEASPTSKTSPCRLR